MADNLKVGLCVLDPTTGLPVDTGAPSRIALPQTVSFSGALTANGDFGPFDMDEFLSFNFRINDIGGGGSIQALGSNDGVQWSTISTLSTSATSNNDAATQQTSVGMYSGARAGKYLKFTLSGYVSGTVSIAGEMSSAPARTFSGNVQSQGVTAHGGATSAKPVRLAGRARPPGTPYTAVSADQVADLVTDLRGNLVTRRPASSTLVSAQVSVGSTPTSILGADTARLGGLIRNVGSATVYIGPSGVTTSTGFPLAAGADLPTDVVAGIVGAIYGITATGTQPVGVLSW